MKELAVAVIFLVLALPVLASATGDQTGKQGERTSQQEQEGSDRQKAESKTQLPLNKNFQPTERIKADTVVAFPADI